MRGAQPDAAFERQFARAAALADGEIVIAATSGGSDSGALAALLAGAASDAGATVVVAHVNHAVRASAWQDEAVVLALAAALGLRPVTVSLPSGPKSEARLRTARYAALSAIGRQVGARRVFTAHHAADQTETVLLALFRGTGPSGLAGMPAQRRLSEDVTLVRPLLGTEPAELRAYLARRCLPFVVDPGNADGALRRNAVRTALGGLREAFPHLDAAVARCAAIAREERDGSRRAALRKHLHRELSATGNARDATFERLDAVVRALASAAPGRYRVASDLDVVLTAKARRSSGPQP